MDSPPPFFDMLVYRNATDNTKVTENCDSYSHRKIDLSFATVIFGSTFNIKSLLYIAIIQWFQKRINQQQKFSNGKELSR